MVKPHDANGEEHARATSSITAPFELLLREPSLRDAVRALFGGTLQTVTPGWPRMAAGAQLAQWLRAGDVLVELAHAPARAAFELGIVLHAESATRLVERLLGAEVLSGTPHVTGAPSEAERGVLAYAAARLCVESARDLLVRDVRDAAGAPALAHERMLVWPFSLATSWGVHHGTLLLGEPLASASTLRASLRVALRDRFEPAALAQLVPDDVLVSDHWTLTHTTQGLSGDAWITSEGTPTAWRARVSDGSLRVLAPSELAHADQLELVLATRTASLLELARLGSGEPLAIHVEPKRVTLAHGGHVLGHGELVSHRGEVGIRVRELAPPSNA